MFKKLNEQVNVNKIIKESEGALYEAIFDNTISETLELVEISEDGETLTEDEEEERRAARRRALKGEPMTKEDRERMVRDTIGEFPKNPHKGISKTTPKEEPKTEPKEKPRPIGNVRKLNEAHRDRIMQQFKSFKREVSRKKSPKLNDEYRKEKTVKVNKHINKRPENGEIEEE